MSFKYLPTNDPWEVSHSNIELKDELSKEAFGQVWKGQMDLNVPKPKQSALSYSKNNESQPETSRKI